MRIATTIEQYFDEADPMGAYGIKYKEAVTKLEEGVREDVVREGKTMRDNPECRIFFPGFDISTK